MFVKLTVPAGILMALATLFATPLVVRRAFSGLDRTALQAREIDIDKRGVRLSSTAVPAEIAPLVGAVNDALSRLDHGYQRHQRFLADAAHELRTPIAILMTRLETLPRTAESKRVVEDVARLASLTEQLLDVQKLEHALVAPERLDLVALSAGVAADLAPLAIGAGYEISLLSEREPIEAFGERSALQRVVVNLIQNAIQHGGRRGTITITIKAPATIEVCDEGPGIPEAEREQVFEPFHRLKSTGRGAGLGLNLVREIVRLHHGTVSIDDGPSGGACFRVALPPIRTGTG
jgi:signal transduction histidine kinase